MKQEVGTIIKNDDPSKQGMLAVALENQSTLVYAYYTAPYGGNGSHGMFAIPEVGDEVIITMPDNSNSWYYLTSIYRVREGSSRTTGLPLDDPAHPEESTLLPDEHIYDAYGVPQRYGIRSPLGNKLVLSDSQNLSFQNIYTKLESAKGKTLLLNDSAFVDSIIIRNEHGDHLKISTKANPSKGQAGRMIEIEAKGPIRVISHEGSIDMKVIDGKEINIENTSTGTKKNPGAPDKFGNINLISKYKDIVIKVLNKKGKVKIKSKGDTNIETEGNTTLETKGTLDIKADMDISMESLTKMTLKAPRIDLNPDV